VKQVLIDLETGAQIDVDPKAESAEEQKASDPSDPKDLKFGALRGSSDLVENVN